MNSSITLSANETYLAEFATLGTSGTLTQFSWFNLFGVSGSASVTVIDRRKSDGTSETRPFTANVPGLIAVPLRNSEFRLKTEVRIVAGNSGFSGEIQVIVPEL